MAQLAYHAIRFNVHIIKILSINIVPASRVYIKTRSETLLRILGRATGFPVAQGIILPLIENLTSEQIAFKKCKFFTSTVNS